MCKVSNFETGTFKNSLFRRIDARVKILALTVILFSNLIAESLTLSSLVLLVSLVVLYLEIPLQIIIRRTVTPLVVSFLVFLAHTFLSGEPLRGLWYSLVVMGGSFLMLSFSLSISETEILRVAKKLKIPEVFIETASLMLRYIFVLRDEAQRIKDAQTVRLGYVKPVNGIRSSASLAGKVFIRSHDKAAKVAEAMTLRGKNG